MLSMVYLLMEFDVLDVSCMNKLLLPCFPPVIIVWIAGLGIANKTNMIFFSYGT